MLELKNRNNALRQNADYMPLTDEQVAYEVKGGYTDHLIKRARHKFWSPSHRRENQDLDVLVHRLTRGYLKDMLSKPFKIFDFEGNEILAEYPKWFYGMNLDRPARKAGALLELDGHVISHFFLKDEHLDYRIYGDLECPPDQWHRYEDNTIYLYHVSYHPAPRAGFFERGTLKSIIRYHEPQDVIHTCRYEDEYMYGISRIYHVWDAITKMRRGSHADAFRRAVKFILGVPDNWKPDRVRKLLAAIKESSENLALAYRLAVDRQGNPIPEIPIFGYTSMARDNPAVGQRSNPSIETGDPEIDRFLMGLGYTKNWLIGNEAGAVTGSEVDLSRDDAEDIAEWGVSVAVLIKDWFDYFYEVGALPKPLPAGARIVCWKEWEFKERMETMMEMAERETEVRDDEAKEKAETHNTNTVIDAEYEVVPYLVIGNNVFIPHKTAIRENVKMMPVQSSTVEEAGSQGKDLVARFKNYPPGEGVYGYHFPNELMAEFYAMALQGSPSPGRFVWDILRGRSIGPAYLTGRPTPGGTSASLIPYDIYSGYQAGSPLEYGNPTQGRPPQGAEGETPLSQLGVPFSETATPSAEGMEGTMAESGMWREARTGRPTKAEEGKTMANPTQSPLKTKPRTRGRKKETEYTTPFGDITPFNITHNQLQKLNSVPNILRAGELMEWKMSKNTAYNLMELFKIMNSSRFRVNSIAYGNEMAFDMALYYVENGQIVKEYACPKEFQKVENHKGPIKLYRDGGHEGEAYIVGEYERLGWDDEHNKPILKMNYDNEKIIALLTQWGRSTSSIIERINAGLAPEMSTEYYCDTAMGDDGRTYQIHISNSKGQARYEGIAIVERGNCPAGKCTFEIEEESTR